MNKNIVLKIRKLPQTPGVYIFRNEKRRVIYVGKAIKLKSRVSSYFQNKNHDIKTRKLIEMIADLEYLCCNSEIEALVVESELIKRYKPKYNIIWKDDKNYSYIKITNDDYPRVFVVRDTSNAESQYIGPFVDTIALKNSLKHIRKIFPFCTCYQPKNKTCLYYHLKLCLGHEGDNKTKKEYWKNINSIRQFFSGNTAKIMTDLKKEMKASAQKLDFEGAARARDKILNLEKLKYVPIGNQNHIESQDQALIDLQILTSLDKLPNRIECFDISNISGHLSVGSMAVFTNGLPDKKNYRRFKIKTVKQIDDFAMLNETVGRRLKNLNTNKDKSFMLIPDIILLDGGKGQLSTILKSYQKLYSSICFLSLAKKNEELYILKDKKIKKLLLVENSQTMFLLQRIRDEAHRFAVTYHRSLRRKEITASILDSIPGIGPKTKRDLIKNFGTIENIRKAELSEITALVGLKKGERIKKNL